MTSPPTRRPTAARRERRRRQNILPVVLLPAEARQHDPLLAELHRLPARRHRHRLHLVPRAARQRKGELGLGDAYCDALVLPADYNGTDCADGPCTQLWEYDGCPAINEMRAACQLVCVLALLFFHWSFVGENRKLLSAGSTSTVGAEVVIEA